MKYDTWALLFADTLQIRENCKALTIKVHKGPTGLCFFCGAY